MTSEALPRVGNGLLDHLLKKSLRLDKLVDPIISLSLSLYNVCAGESLMLQN